MAIGAATDLIAAEAVRLLSRRQWRERLRTAAGCPRRFTAYLAAHADAYALATLRRRLATIARVRRDARHAFDSRAPTTIDSSTCRTQAPQTPENPDGSLRLCHTAIQFSAMDMHMLYRALGSQS